MLDETELNLHISIHTLDLCEFKEAAILLSTMHHVVIFAITC